MINISLAFSIAFDSKIISIFNEELEKQALFKKRLVCEQGWSTLKVDSLNY